MSRIFSEPGLKGFIGFPRFRISRLRLFETDFQVGLRGTLVHIQRNDEYVLKHNQPELPPPLEAIAGRESSVSKESCNLESGPICKILKIQVQIK